MGLRIQRFMWIGTLLESASSGHLRNCSFWHMCIGSEVSSCSTPTYVSIIDESFHKRLHVLNLLSSLQQEQHIHRLLTRHCAKTCPQINTVVTPCGLNDWNMCVFHTWGWQGGKCWVDQWWQCGRTGPDFGVGDIDNTVDQACQMVVVIDHHWALRGAEC